MARIRIGNVFPSIQWLMERCAPAGHGLGDVSNSAKYSVTPDNIDTLFAAGWYQYYDRTYTSLARLGFSGGLLVVPTFEGADQIFFPRFQNKVMPGTYGIRKYEEGVWSEWYIQNPVMNVGIEYLTTERYMGKPVYAALVNVGAYPETGMRNASTGITATGIVRFNASIGYTSLPLAGNMEINTFHSGEEITVQLHTAGERIYTNDVFVTLYYIKN